MGLPNTNLGSEPRKAVGRMDAEHVPRGWTPSLFLFLGINSDSYREQTEATLLVTTANGALLLSTIY